MVFGDNDSVLRVHDRCPSRFDGLDQAFFLSETQSLLLAGHKYSLLVEKIQFTPYLPYPDPQVK
jgi:hypothetical protein